MQAEVLRAKNKFLQYSEATLLREYEDFFKQNSSSAQWSRRARVSGLSSLEAIGLLEAMDEKRKERERIQAQRARLETQQQQKQQEEKQ